MKEPKRILVASLGASPSVITETLWALMHPEEQRDKAVSQLKAFVPEKIHIITTTAGKKAIESVKLMDHIKELYRQGGHDSPRVVVDIPKLPNGLEISDIRTQEENIAFADYITKVIYDYSNDRDVQLHVSLAGGRKTMTSFTHAAMTFFGRVDDRLSHVLVEPEKFEHCRGFFWPKQPEQEIACHRKTPEHIEEKKLIAGDARVELVETPYVRLRFLLDEKKLKECLSYSNVVQQLQELVDLQFVNLDFDERIVKVGPHRVELDPLEFAFYAVIATAWRYQWEGAGPEGIGKQYKGWLTYRMFCEDARVKDKFEEFYSYMFSKDGTKRAKGLKYILAGSEYEAEKEKMHRCKLVSKRLSPIKSRVEKKLKDSLGVIIYNRIGIHAYGRKESGRFGLLIEPYMIHFNY